MPCFNGTKSTKGSPDKNQILLLCHHLLLQFTNFKASKYFKKQKLGSFYFLRSSNEPKQGLAETLFSPPAPPTSMCYFVLFFFFLYHSFFSFSSFVGFFLVRFILFFYFHFLFHAKSICILNLDMRNHLEKPPLPWKFLSYNQLKEKYLYPSRLPRSTTGHAIFSLLVYRISIWFPLHQATPLLLSMLRSNMMHNLEQYVFKVLPLVCTIAQLKKLLYLVKNWLWFTSYLRKRAGTILLLIMSLETHMYFALMLFTK